MGRRRLTSAVSWAAVSALIAAGITADGAQATSRCDRAGKTVARTATVRVYRVGSSRVEKAAPRYFACLRHRDMPARRLPVLQPDSGAYIGFRSFRIAGHLVAYVQVDSFAQDLTEFVWSVSVATWRTWRYGATDTFYDVTSLAVNRSGSVAYIDRDVCTYCRYDPYSPSRLAFHVYRGVGGQRHLLDSGDDIDPTSVMIVGSEVQWARGGQPRSAPL